MENQSVIERFGGVTKEEPLTTLGNDLVLANTQVMESKTPFFGYYNDGPISQTGAYLYFVLDGPHSFETILRATHNVQKKVNYTLDCTPGTTSMYTHTCQVIRVKQLKQYGQISHLQWLFQQEGILFKKQFAMLKGEMVLIRLQKFLYLVPLGEGMYEDEQEKNVAYFTTPGYIAWDAFKNLTLRVKYHTDLLFFDAATAFFYENRQIVNLIRIYKEYMNVEKLKPIRDRYLKLINF